MKTNYYYQFRKWNSGIKATHPEHVENSFDKWLHGQIRASTSQISEYF